jgi:hypothetical protein
MPLETSRTSRSRALRARDAGLRRVSVVTRVAVVGSVAAAGIFTAMAAWAQPGRTKQVRTNRAGAGAPTRPVTVPSPGAPAVSTPATTPATTPSTAAPGDGSAGGDSLSPPATLPDPGYQSSGPAVVSGAS